MIKKLRISYNRLLMKKKEMSGEEKHAIVQECIEALSLVKKLAPLIDADGDGSAAAGDGKEATDGALFGAPPPSFEWGGLF